MSNSTISRKVVTMLDSLPTGKGITAAMRAAANLEQGAAYEALILAGGASRKAGLSAAESALIERDSFQVAIEKSYLQSIIDVRSMLPARLANSKTISSLETSCVALGIVDGFTREEAKVTRAAWLEVGKLLKSEPQSTKAGKQTPAAKALALYDAIQARADELYTEHQAAIKAQKAANQALIENQAATA